MTSTENETPKMFNLNAIGVSETHSLHLSPRPSGDDSFGTIGVHAAGVAVNMDLVEF